MMQETFLDLEEIVHFLEEVRKFEPEHDDKLKKPGKALYSCMLNEAGGVDGRAPTPVTLCPPTTQFLSVSATVSIPAERRMSMWWCIVVLATPNDSATGSRTSSR